MEPWQQDRIVAFYEEFNPENVKNIPEILRVFSGREDVLVAKLHKKYGCSPDIVSQEAREAESAQPLAEFDPSFRPNVAPPVTGGSFDGRSSSFNAQLALVQNRLDNVSSSSPLDNMYKCRMLLPPNDPQYIPMKAKTTVPAERRPKSAVAVVKKPPVLHAIAELHTVGPLSLLHACLMARARVVVVVRRICSIRGTCTGYLKGFDKHMNIVLFDVSETFVPLRHVASIDGVHGRGIAPGSRHPLAVSRFVKQLLIRGDNVVLVYPTQPLPPPLAPTQ